MDKLQYKPVTREKVEECFKEMNSNRPKRELVLFTNSIKLVEEFDKALREELKRQIDGYK